MPDNLWSHNRPIILASTSQTRLKLLEDISLPVEICAANIDERAIEAEMQKKGANPVQIALSLAQAKGKNVAQQKTDRCVVAADQTLALNSEQFHKPKSLEDARYQLLRMKGKTHQLHSAVVCYHGQEKFEHVETACLTMRDFSESFLDAYLLAAGDKVKQSVGAYQLEGLGIHLFEKIDGDHSTILGLPLLPLLAFFRQAGLMKV